MTLSAATWSAAALLSAGAAVGTWSYLYFSDTQRSSKQTGLSYSNVGELRAFPGGDCVNTLLSEKDRALLNQTDDKDTSWKDLPDRSTNEPIGCVAVSWDKQTWKDGLWSGVIRYEWLFSWGDETLVLNGLSSTSSFTQKEQLFIFWKWRHITKTTGKRSFVEWNKQVNLPEKKRPLNHVLPESPAFQFGGKGKYWGFNPDYSKVRRRARMQDEEPIKVEHFEDRGKWTPGGKRSFSEWAKNFSKLYALDDRVKALLTAKNGSWRSF